MALIELPGERDALILEYDLADGDGWFTHEVSRWV
jgi:hypothetical protein